MASQFVPLLSDLPKYKRHISFFEHNFTQVCSGINLESICSNPICKSARNFGGLVIIKFPGVKSCVYQDMVPYLRCPSCGVELRSERVKGVVFVRCEAKIKIGEESVVFRVRGEETVLWEFPYQGADVSITLLGSDPEPKTGSKEFLNPIDGVNLSAICRNNECQASKTKDGLVVIRVGQVESRTYQELLNNRSCPSCNHPLEPRCFRGVIFSSCQGEVEIAGNVRRFDAHRMPELCMIDSDNVATIRIRPTITDIHSAPNSSPETVRSKQEQPSSPTKTNDRIGVMQKGGTMSYESACHGINFEAHCPNERCSAYKENSGFVNIMSGHMMACDYRAAIQTLACPSCSISIPPTCFRGVALVRCRGEILIGEEKKFFESKGNEIHKISIPHDGTRVKIELYTKEEYESTHTELGSSDRTYTKVCDGVNFIAFCKNPSCQAFKEYDGCVNVKRDEQFIKKNGFSATRCNYSREIQGLVCPSCGNPLNTHFVQGVALVRCKGTLESSGKSENFLAESNNIIRHKYDRSDASAVIEYVVHETISSSIIPQRGLNLLAKCTNSSCPSQSQASLEGVVRLHMGEVTDCRLQRLIQGRTCPNCHHALPPASFIRVMFTQCTARVKTTDLVTSYIFGQRMEVIPIDITKDPVVDILPVHTKDLSMEPYESRYKQMKRGMNLKVICSNLDCSSKKSSDGIIIISLEMKLYTFKDIFSTVKCPSCNNTLSHMILLTLSFVHCRSEMLVEKERFILEAGNGEVIDFKPDSSASDVTIHVMEKEATTSVLFPDIQIEGSTSKGGDFSHASVCHGLNFLVRCSNPTCAAVRNSEFVMIQAGHIIDRDIRRDMQSLDCSSCEAKILPHQVLRVAFLCCSGEITIGGKKEIFNPTGQVTSDFKIPSDNSPVFLKVYHKEYHIKQNPAIGFLLNTYTKHHNGINFHCYCKNPSCQTIKDADAHGLVIVQRDDFMVRKYGYNPSTCYYSQEISQLNCTSCGSHLKKYYVWGVGLLHCLGTITRDGSPIESFSSSMGQVVEYQLDTGDTSLRIEFHII